jgi:hypothetical protein
MNSAPALVVDQPALREASTAAVGSARSAATRLREACREEIARFTRIVRELSCHALLRGISREPTVSAPVYDCDGSAMASIALFENAGRVVEPTERILRVLIRSTARAMSERWFRLFHRRDWIIAALREDETHTSIILAVDRSRTLIGADHAAREFLRTTGRHFEPGLTVAEFFGCDFTPVDEASRIVEHEMFVSLFPNWKGQRQARIVKLDGKELHLSPNRPPMFNGSLKMATIIWRRANPNI